MILDNTLYSYKTKGSCSKQYIRITELVCIAVSG